MGDAEQKTDIGTALGILKQRFGPRFSDRAAIRGQHANTLTWLEAQPPDAVIWPETTAEVREVVEIASQHNVPIIAFGAGTSLEGQVNAPRGGISLDFARMNRVLKVNERDLDCVVEAGISRKQLNDYLRDTGLFFPVDPGTDEATLGGMASTRASGTTAVRYGTMRDNVLSLTAVMADGNIVTTARRARKSSAGYDLTRLLVGAEGTLAIITELTVRLFGVPEKVIAAVCPFSSIEGACNATIEAIQLGLGMARIELLDGLQIKAVNLHSKSSFEEVPTLFIEFHGSETGARDQVEKFGAIASAQGALRFDWAEKEDDRRKLWKARHDVFWAVKSAWPGRQAFSTDVCVPISRLAECVGETQADIAEARLVAPIVGHVGDGNFHCVVMVDMADPGEVSRAKSFSDRLVDRAMAMGGTSTGEHGVGQGKARFMQAEHGPGVGVMAAIKQALDPKGIFNPGKIFPE